MIHRDLLPTLIPAGAIVLLCSLFGWVGLLRPDLLGWDTPTPVPVIGILVVFAVVMPALFMVAFRRHLRALWVMRHVEPSAVRVKLIKEDGDPATYDVLIGAPLDSASAEKIPVHAPRWNPQLDAWVRAHVYRDPVTKKPVVFNVDGRFLWSMTG